MYKIGDFSKLGQVSTRMLRHYDQLGLLKPSHTDKFTGYRYYTVDQLSRLHRIVALSKMGVGLEQIAGLLDQNGNISSEQLRGMLALRQAELAQELQAKQQQLAAVEARLRQLEGEAQPTPYEMVIKAVPPQPVAALRQVVPTIGAVGYYCAQMYRQLYATLARMGIKPLQPEITIYHNEEYQEQDIEMETAIPIDAEHLQRADPDAPVILRELPGAEQVAALIYEGSFDDIPPAILALLRYVGELRYTVVGPLRELHLSGPAHPEDEQAGARHVVGLELPIQRVDVEA